MRPPRALVLNPRDICFYIIGEREFYLTLRDEKHQEAFNNMLRMWGYESAVMDNVNIPCLMDILHQIVNVHTKQQTENLKQQVDALRQQFRALK